MSRALSSASSLETLRKEAKRWLKALRAGGSTMITASAGGRSDSVAVAVRAPGETACTGFSAPASPAVGTILRTQGPPICLTGGAATVPEYTPDSYPYLSLPPN